MPVQLPYYSTTEWKKYKEEVRKRFFIEVKTVVFDASDDFYETITKDFDKKPTVTINNFLDNFVNPMLRRDTRERIFRFREIENLTD